MKKLLFTAFAMIAFTGIAMAKNEVDQKQYLRDLCPSCFEFAMDRLEDFAPADAVEANEQYQGLIEYCYSNGGC